MKSFYSIFSKAFNKPLPFDTTSLISKNRIQIKKIIQKQNSPFYICSKQIVLNRLEQIQNSLKTTWGKYEIAYSFKTNYALAKSKLLLDKSLAEVVSEEEYELALKTGYKGIRIIYNGPNKSETSLLLALRNKTLINIDNQEELKTIIQLIKKNKIDNPQIGIRLNTKIKHIRPSRFGFSIESNEALIAIKTLQQNKIICTGLQIHIGTDIDRVSCFKETADKVGSFVNQVFQELNTKIKIIDLGGGFPSSSLKPFWKKSWSPRSIDNYINAITLSLKNNLDSHIGTPTLIFEPGRYLIDDAVFFVSKIISAKTTKNTQQITLDTSVTMLPLIYYHPLKIKAFSCNLNMNNRVQKQTTIYGSTCKEDDILFHGKLSSSKFGDYIIFFVTGAYNQSMGSAFIFPKPKTFFM